MEDLRTVLNRTGIHATEFAALVKVHRVTVQHWLTGTAPRQAMTKDAVASMLNLIQKAEKLKLIPRLADLDRTERLPAIRRALRAAHQTS